MADFSLAASVAAIPAIFLICLQRLTSLDGGYWVSNTLGKDQSGQKGDFVILPEMPQIFWMITKNICGCRMDSTE